MSSSPVLAPTQVLVLSEIGGLMQLCQSEVPTHEAEFVHRSLNAIGDDELKKYEVILADPPTFASSGVADRCAGGSLRWVQSTYAGVDALIRLSDNRSYTVTRLAGVFGQAMAEYCMMHVLAQERRMLRDAGRQRDKEWGTRGSVAQAGRGASTKQRLHCLHCMNHVVRAPPLTNEWMISRVMWTNDDAAGGVSHRG